MQSTVPSGIVQTDVVELRAQREVGQNAKIHAAANAIRELGIVPAAVGPLNALHPPATEQME